MCGGGGGGGSGTQQYNWNDTIAPYWAQSLSWAKGLTNPDPGQPGAYQQYHGPDQSVYGANSPIFANSSNDPTHRITNLTPQQQAGMQDISLYALDPTYGVADPNQAQNAGLNYEQKTLSGGYLGSDPYASASNPYSGSSPAFEQALQGGLKDITNAYQQGTAADTTRMFNQAGAFGGSAYGNAVGMNENALAKQLQNYTAGMVNDQYNRSAQLAGQDLSRGSSAYENQLGLMNSALSPTQNEQNLMLQRGNAAIGVGDAQRSYNQDLTNQAYTDWQNQQNRQYQMLDYFSGILGRAQGGVSPNMTYTTPNYQASPYSQVLGAGLLGYGLTH